MGWFATLIIADSLQGDKSAQPSTQVLNSMRLGVLKSKRPSLARSNRLIDLMKRANGRTDKRAEQYLVNQIAALERLKKIYLYKPMF
jgi:hypothetical protein